jgi:hypothetical protein
MLLLLLGAFLLGMLGERWLHGGEREAALRELEEVLSGYGSPPGRPR